VLFRSLTDNPGKKLYAVKTTRGGTGIYNTGLWNPLTGVLVRMWQQRLDRALSWAANNGIKFAPLCMLYHQGEWDADMGPSGIAAYKQNVSNLFAHMRGYLGAPNVPIINGQLSTAFSVENIPINNIFAELNAIDKFFKTVDMSEHQTFVPAETDGVGTIHYDAAALRYMGEQMYVQYKGFNLL
jgi:hypothetical protein